MSPALTTSSTHSFASRMSPERESATQGFLSPLQPIEPLRPSPNSTLSKVEKNTHEYRPPGPSDSRCPCPALNTLANHGYLPRDGKNIDMSALLAALQHRDTYYLSTPLAEVLAKGGVLLTDESLLTRGVLFNGDALPSLHHLSLHNKVEHNASMVHKNTAEGEKFAPTRTDTRLLNDFLGDRPTVELTDVARRRVALEHVSALDPLHSEIARGEWALVLNVFGHAHGGKIPAEALRVWLYENRFPDGWRPDHQQGLLDTVQTSKKIRHAMQDLRENEKQEGWDLDDEKLACMLRSEPEECRTAECH